MSSINNKKPVRFKRYFLMMSLFLLAVLLLLLIGLGVATYLGNQQPLDYLPGTDNGYLLAWRIFLYGVLLALLSPSVAALIIRLQKQSHNINKALLRYHQQRLLIAIVFYELVFVQNGLKKFINWGYHYVS
ncbi:MAG: hypothetical protein ACRBCI_12135 [Cellvibrionaceae bacterium]